MGQNILTRYGSCRIPIRSLWESMLNETSHPVYITASEVLLTYDREKITQTMLSNYVGIMSMRPWSCQGEKTS